MARDGNGTYVPVGSPFINGEIIDADEMMAKLNDMDNALSQSVSKDGQTVITGDLKMGGRKLTGMGDGYAATDSVTLGQVKGGVAIASIVPVSATWQEFELSSDYIAFQFEFSAVSPLVSSFVCFQLSTDAGANWISAAESYTFGSYGSGGGVPAVTSPVLAIGYSINDVDEAGWVGVMRLDLAAIDPGFPRMFCTGAGVSPTVWQGSTYYGGTAAAIDRPDRIRFAFSGTTWRNQGRIIQRGIRA